MTEVVNSRVIESIVHYLEDPDLCFQFETSVIITNVAQLASEEEIDYLCSLDIVMKLARFLKTDDRYLLSQTVWAFCFLCCGSCIMQEI